MCGNDNDSRDRSGQGRNPARVPNNPEGPDGHLVKQLTSLQTPASHIEGAHLNSSSTSNPASSYHTHWETAGCGSRVWISVTQVGDPDQLPGTWLQRGPAPMVVFRVT